jgi:urease accessory protein UreE
MVTQKQLAALRKARAAKRKKAKKAGEKSAKKTTKKTLNGTKKKKTMPEGTQFAVDMMKGLLKKEGDVLYAKQKVITMLIKWIESDYK